MHGLVLLCINQQRTFEVPSLTDSKDMIAGRNLKKTGHVTLTTHIREYFVIPRLTHDIFYLHTNFDESHFSRPGDMIAGVKI